MNGRIRAFLGVVVLVVIGVGGYAWYTAGRRTPPDIATVAAGDPSPAAPGRLDQMPAAPFVFIRSLVADATHGQVAAAPLTAPEGPRFFTPLTCERVFFAAGRGVCLKLGVEGIRTTYTAEVFDGAFQVVGRVPLTGVPSRVRVSPDGRRAGITVFEEGHSYAENGFSTRTTLIETSTAAVITDLESFAVTRDGQPVPRSGLQLLGRDLREGRQPVLRDPGVGRCQVPGRRGRRSAERSGDRA